MIRLSTTRLVFLTFCSIAASCDNKGSGPSKTADAPSMTKNTTTPSVKASTPQELFVEYKQSRVSGNAPNFWTLLSMKTRDALTSYSRVQLEGAKTNEYAASMIQALCGKEASKVSAEELAIAQIGLGWRDDRRPVQDMTLVETKVEGMRTVLVIEEKLSDDTTRRTNLPLIQEDGGWRIGD